MKNNLKQIRTKSGKTQKQVADELGLSISAYRTYEQGTRHLTDEMLIQLSDHFSTSVDSILGTEYVENPYAPQFIQDKKMHAFISSSLRKMQPEARNLFYELATNFMKLNKEGKRKLVEDADTMIRSKKYESFGSSASFSNEDLDVQRTA